MAITRTGAFFEDNVSYTYGFTNSSGGLEVTGGDVLTLTSDTGIGPFLSAGRVGGGAVDPNAIGTIVIRDPGSALDVIAGGSASVGARLEVARGEDTRGLMQVLNGASFSITDPFGADNSDAAGGGEYVWIGRDPGAQGRLEVTAADFLLSGTGVDLAVGRDFGTGSLSVTNGSGFVVKTTSAGNDDFTGFRVGDHNGNGTAEIAESFALVQAGRNYGAVVDIGRRGGTGSLNISGDTAEPNREGLFLIGNAYSPYVEFRVGYQGGTGDVTMRGGTLGIVNAGVEVFREGGFERWDAVGDLGGFAGLSVGFRDGTGTFTGTEGAVIFVGGSQDAVVFVGIDEGAEGEMTLDASKMEVRSFDQAAGLQIGEWQGESTGQMTLTNGTDVLVAGHQWAYAVLGRWEGSDGRLDIDGGSELRLFSEDGGAAVHVGWDGGLGALTLSGPDSLLQLEAAETYFFVGQNDGTGTVTISDGAALEMEAWSWYAELLIGIGGGSGELIVDDARLRVLSQSDEAVLQIGAWRESGAEGLLVLRNGSEGLIGGWNGIFANVGRWEGNEGRLEVLSGSELRLLAPADQSANLRIGRDGGEGHAVVDGADSLLRLQGWLEIGRDGGTGTLEITDGGFVRNTHESFTRTTVGRGADSTGHVTLDAGTLLTRSNQMNVRLDIGVDGGTGTMDAVNGSSLRVGSDFADANIEVGYAAGVGTLTVKDSMLDLFAPMRGEDDAPLDTFAWMLVGTEGGTGVVTFDNADVNIAAGQGAGFRIGTRWSNTEDNTGYGLVTLRNSATVYAESLQEDTNFWVGGGEGSYGEARILSGSVLDLSGNGWVPVGYATNGMTGGGMGFLEVSGAGSLLTGVRGLTVGGGGSEGLMRVSDSARALIGGLEADRNIWVNVGFRDGGLGELDITNALMSVQAGTGAASDQQHKGAGLGFGEQGGTGIASITGARGTDPDAPHGLIVLGNAASDYAGIEIGRDAGSTGTVTVRGAFFGAQNDGTTFGADGPINLPGDGGFASVQIGENGGTGSLDIGGNAELFAISGTDSAHIRVGRGAGASGVLDISDSTQVEIIARQFDAWLLAGSEGGASGSVTINDSSLLIDAARSGGIRLGTSWFDTPDQVGTGHLTIENGSDVTIRANVFGANLHVGGGAGSMATATISDSTVTMEGDAHRLVIVGGTPAFLAGTGGTGSLTLEGADTRITGARDIVIGVNGGTGTMRMQDGAQIALVDEGGGVDGRILLGVGGGRVREGAPTTLGDGLFEITGSGTSVMLTDADVSVVSVGGVGATGAMRVLDGAQVTLDAGVSFVDIGVDGGIGLLDIAGQGSRVTVDGDDARVHIGRVRDANVSVSDGPSLGIVRIDSGAELDVSTKVEVGDASGHRAVLALGGGRLLTPFTELHAGARMHDNMLLGHGQIIGSAGQPSLLLSGSSFFVGDVISDTGMRSSATGEMQITGTVIAQQSAVHFDLGLGAAQYDQITVTGGSFAMEGGSLTIAATAAAETLLQGNGLRLIAASEGVFLNDVTMNLAPLPSGLQITTEFRNEGTELWAVLGDVVGGPSTNIPLPGTWRDWLDFISGDETPGAPPPAPPIAANPGSVADPHLTTLDGLGYSFHAAGEFVMLRALNSPLEVQARMVPVAANASENVAAAIRLSGGRVMLDAASPDQVLINGNAVALASGESVNIGADLVYRTGNTWNFVHRHDPGDPEAITVISILVVDERLDISAFANAALMGQVEGLWGNFDGNPDTDLSLRDGRLVARPLRFGDDPETGELGLYGAFRDEWRVKDMGESLFTYAPGQGPDSFYLPDYPARMVTVDDFDQDLVDAAMAIVMESGLTPGSVGFENALFDLLATGNTSYVEAAAAQQAVQQSLPETLPVPQAPAVAGGSLEGLVTLAGKIIDAGGGAFSGAQVSFTPDGRNSSHLRSTSSDGEFSFELLPVSGGVLTAARAYDLKTDGAVTALDALDVLRLAVGLDPSWGPASPLNFIAADITQSGQVTALDALEVLRAAVGLDSTHAPRWIFFDDDTDLSGIGQNNTQVDTSFVIGDLGEGIDGISLRGILLGNMQDLV